MVYIVDLHRDSCLENHYFKQDGSNFEWDIEPGLNTLQKGRTETKLNQVPTLFKSVCLAGHGDTFL